jgi:hypothetical protein
MPEKVHADIKESLRAAHPDWSEETLEDKTYATMQSRGLLKRKHGRRKRKKGGKTHG